MRNNLETAQAAIFPGATEQLEKLASMSGVDREQWPNLLKSADLFKNNTEVNPGTNMPMITLGLGPT